MLHVFQQVNMVGLLERDNEVRVEHECVVCGKYKSK